MIILSLLVHKTIVSDSSLDRWFEKWLLLGCGMAGRGPTRALFLVLVMFSAAFSGCFGETEQVGINSEKDVVITPQTLSGGFSGRNNNS